MFNDGGFLEQVNSGILRAVLMTEKHPSPLKSGHPLCTLSQTLAYFDSHNQEVARVHQYKRQDRSIGGSGRPDPKRLLIDGIWYYV